ncbi:methyltransferase domain-containing protein [Kineococcus aurantiacus]|uniref:2-polyprenyl-3-methyl-5-hydroxy-6-metoxy-1, 4-benzoquinol methylase n=1 Tax=Kineococcus aurantiacus TaxID=37633 RepID=A0A7Y9DMK3_9ACTN|nr:2-polyprenyl-3-methyl-5-hydroxy-6-metoxy-1,4-benzoquinol methylase [Kineococcus aurantiacus]
MSSPDVQQAYSSLARQYIDLLGSVEAVHRDDLRLIERHLGHLTGPVLDLGCGPGHLTGHLHAAGCEVTGIDLVPEFIAHARRTHPGVPFEVGSLLDVARADASVAGVLAWYSLIHLDPGQLDGALVGVRRLLAPGGVLVVGFFEGAVCEPFEHKVTTAYRWPVEELVGRLAAAGFAEVDRLQRPREGERRPHAVLVVRAV